MVGGQAVGRVWLVLRVVMAQLSRQAGMAFTAAMAGRVAGGQDQGMGEPLDLVQMLQLQDLGLVC